MKKLTPAQTKTLKRIYDDSYITTGTIHYSTMKVLVRHNLIEQPSSASIFVLTDAGRELAESLFGSDDTAADEQEVTFIRVTLPPPITVTVPSMSIHKTIPAPKNAKNRSVKAWIMFDDNELGLLSHEFEYISDTELAQLLADPNPAYCGAISGDVIYYVETPDPQPPAGESQPLPRNRKFKDDTERQEHYERVQKMVESVERKVRNVKDDSGKTVIRTNTADTARIAEMLIHQQATEKIRDRIRHRTTRVKVTRDYPLPTGAALHGRGTRKATSKPIAARKAKQAVQLANMQRKRRKQANKAIVDLAMAFRDIERKRQRVA